MTLPIIWLVALGPAALLAVGLASRERTYARAQLHARWAYGASLFAMCLAVAAAVAFFRLGALRTGTFGVAGVGIGIYVDGLSAILLLLVCFVSSVVTRYSRHYLQGDPNQARFTRWLCWTLAAVLILIISGNLLQFALAWVATSIGLHRLLLFYPDRQAAILASRKKFIASRLGDLCLLSAMVLLYRIFGSLDYSMIFAGTQSAVGELAKAQWVDTTALLLVVAALLKSAQFPLHGWLTEVMETPTPVSALLHAGIINAGGFLVLRFSSLIAQSGPALYTLAIVGGFTALFGSVVMLTQTSIKVSLTFSTIAQMGFMMLQCGLGAFSAALLHIVAHSLYKAHAFLSSGSVINLARADRSLNAGARPHPARMALAILIVLCIAIAVGALFRASLVSNPGVFALGAIVMLGLAHLIANAIDERPSVHVIGRILGFAVLVALGYFALQKGTQALLAGSLPAAQPLRDTLHLVIVILVVASFAGVTLLQNLLPGLAGKPRWQALFVHLSHGLYVNTLANRLALRYWPGTAGPPHSDGVSARGRQS